MTDVLTVADAAREAHRAGLCVVPASQHNDPTMRTKKPDGPWKRYQTDRPDEAQIEAWFSDGRRTGFGAICGTVSGGLEMIELEGRAVDAGMWSGFLDAAERAGLGALMLRIIEGYSEITPSGGYHLLYRCAAVDGNTILAAAPDPAGRDRPLIETRGEGGFTILAPSHGNVHPTGGAWIRDAGSFATIATISTDERRALWCLARSFDRRPTATPEPPQPPVAQIGDLLGPSRNGESWVDATIADYNARTTWADVLAGTFEYHHRSGAIDHWRYIGQNGAYGATTNANGTDRLCIHSGTAAASGWQIQPSTYDRFSAHVFIATRSHDTRARLDVARGLRERGYGPQPIKRTTVEPAPEIPPLEEFWCARPELAHVRDHALALRASPWATLGVTLARILAGMPPTVQLPNIIGGYGSLNLFVGLVGPSGGGKGAAIAAGAGAVDIGLLHGVETHTLGSGHAIAHAYAHREKGELVIDTDRAMFLVEEVDHLVGLSGQIGSTLLAELRRLYMGERLGHLFVDPAKRIPIDAHTYRACVLVGIQPTRAGVILDDSDGGTPQRFLWMPTTYPHPDERPEPPPRAYPWKAPTLRQGRHVMTVCDAAVREIDQAALERSRGMGDPLDGHRLLCREKVAAALALLAGRADINVDDWSLSSTITTISDHTRAGVIASLGLAAAQRNVNRAKAEGERAVIVEDVREKAAIARAAQGITRRLSREIGEWIPGNTLRKSLHSLIRPHFDTAIEALITAGQIESQQTESGPGGGLYRLVGGKS